MLPIFERVGRSIIGLDNKYSQNCNCKNNSRNESPLIKSSVGIRRFVLAVEGFRTAGNCAGKAVLITLLKNNCNNYKCCGNEKQYKKWQMQKKAQEQRMRQMMQERQQGGQGGPGFGGQDGPQGGFGGGDF